VSEGTVFQRADGRWCAKYKDIRGTWRYLYRKSKAEAKRALRQALEDRDNGIIPPSKMTVAALLDEWLEDMRDEVGRRTWMTREGFVRNHIKPALGPTKLASLTADDARDVTGLATTTCPIFVPSRPPRKRLGSRPLTKHSLTFAQRTLTLCAVL
jgi:hypothetical protein